MAAAAAAGANLDPVVSHQQPEFARPGNRSPQVGEECGYARSLIHQGRNLISSTLAALACRIAPTPSPSRVMVVITIHLVGERSSRVDRAWLLLLAADANHDRNTTAAMLDTLHPGWASWMGTQAQDHLILGLELCYRPCIWGLPSRVCDAPGFWPSSLGSAAAVYQDCRSRHIRGFVRSEKENDIGDLLRATHPLQ